MDARDPRFVRIPDKNDGTGPGIADLSVQQLHSGLAVYAQFLVIGGYR